MLALFVLYSLAKCYLKALEAPACLKSSERRSFENVQTKFSFVIKLHVEGFCGVYYYFDDSGPVIPVPLQPYQTLNLITLDNSNPQDRNEHFISILHGCWWAIVTITTVGYGDLYPRSVYTR